MSFKDRLAFFQNAVSQQNSDTTSNSHSASSKTSNYTTSRDPKNNNFRDKQLNSTANKPQKKVQQMKEIQNPKSSTSTKEDPIPKSNRKGFADKMAFFNNQISDKNASIKSTQKKEEPKREIYTSKPKPEEKIKDTNTKTVDSTSCSKYSSKTGGFAAKMAFFNNQINNQDTPGQTSTTKVMSKPKENPKLKESFAPVTKPVETSKDAFIPKSKQFEAKKEDPKPLQTTGGSSRRNNGFAAKMAFFNGQSNNQDFSSKPSPSKETPRKKTEEAKSKFADKLAMFNSLNGPLGRPLEEKKKETSTDLSSPNESNADNIPIRPRRSQTLPPALPEPIKKDDVALTIANDDSTIDEKPQGMQVRRNSRGLANKRRPPSIPEY